MYINVKTVTCIANKVSLKFIKESKIVVIYIVPVFVKITKLALVVLNRQVLIQQNNR